mmetsp:Transcript_30787/g.66670  ORF Transcript_30787/g.66670 Transcript_30787/m.66670 type:complete len:96 (+) Transcript_30787:1251-1538(+)
MMTTIAGPPMEALAETESAPFQIRDSAGVMVLVIVKLDTFARKKTVSGEISAIPQNAQSRVPSCSISAETCYVLSFQVSMDSSCPSLSMLKALPR